MPTFKQIKCDLIVAGEAAREYGLEELDGSIVKVHVIAVSGTKYGLAIDIGTRIPRGKFFWCVVWVDGRTKVYDWVTEPRELLIKYAEERQEGPTGVGIYDKRRLRFGDLDTVDFGEPVAAETKLEELGTIKISFHRARPEGTGSSSSSSSSDWDSKSDTNGEEAETLPASESHSLQPIHEELLKGKAITHVTKFGSVKKTEEVEEAAYEVIDETHEPYAVFIFRYTSKQILLAEGIVPRTPSPDNFDDDVERMDPIQMRREMMKMRKEKEVVDIKKRPRGE